MKLDLFKKLREREKHITRLHIILFVLVVTIAIVVIVTVKSSGAKKLARYKKLEKDFKTATVYYYGKKADQIEEYGYRIITMDTLIENGYLQDDITNECVGYTIITNFKNDEGNFKVEYEPYIKCGDSYTTVDYEPKYLEK